MRSADQGESMRDSHSQEQQTCDGSRMPGLQGGREADGWREGEERVEPLEDAGGGDSRGPQGSTDAGEERGEEKEEDPREEAGCVLWDLAATQTHADFLVRLLPSLAVFLCHPL